MRGFRLRHSSGLRVAGQYGVCDGPRHLCIPQRRGAEENTIGTRSELISQLMSLERSIRLARASRDQAEKELIAELRIPSISTLSKHRDDVRRNAEWLKERFVSLGMHTELHDVSADGHAVLLAEWIQ